MHVPRPPPDAGSRGRCPNGRSVPVSDCPVGVPESGITGCAVRFGCAGQDSNLRSLSAMDLQSIAFDRSATDAYAEYTTPTGAGDPAGHPPVPMRRHPNAPPPPPSDNPSPRGVEYPYMVSRICTVLSGIVLLLALCAVPVYAQNSETNPPPGDGVLAVNCGFGDADKEDCDVEHLFELADRFLGVLIWLAVTGVGLVIVWHGVILSLNIFFPGDFQSAKTKTLGALKLSVAGLFLVLAAWLIVKSFFGLFGYIRDPFTLNAPAQPESAESPR